MPTSVKNLKVMKLNVIKKFKESSFSNKDKRKKKDIVLFKRSSSVFSRLSKLLNNKKLKLTVWNVSEHKQLRIKEKSKLIELLLNKRPDMLKLKDKNKIVKFKQLLLLLKLKDKSKNDRQKLIDKLNLSKRGNFKLKEKKKNAKGLLQLKLKDSKMRRRLKKRELLISKE